jgi:serine/threonine-protein kinase
MATVYLAHDLKHDRKVAIKVLRPELSAVIGAERFLREIKTIATLQHPHILGLIDSGEVNGTAYYVMPFVEGESLRDRLRREKQLPIDDAVRLATEVAGALDYAHRHGVIHRDIKPENVMLHDGSALVADFGIALAVSSAGGGSRMTETGMSLGTPHYMSPEQAMGERVLTARSDVYALGAMTYEMLVGEPPFTGPTAQAIVARVVTEEPRPLLPQRRSIPAEVEAAVLTALQKLPADRFATAAEFATALVSPLAATRRMAVTGAGRPGRRRFGWLPTALAGLAVFGLGALAAALVLRRPAPRFPPVVLRYAMTLPDTGALVDHNGSGLAYAPDGSVFAYTSRLGVMLRRSDQLEAALVPGGRRGVSPFFSPDGQWLGYMDGATVRKVPLAGGAPVTICDSCTGYSFSWGSDDTVRYHTAPAASPNSRILMAVSARGGRPYEIARPDSAIDALRGPILVPDTRTVLFSAFSGSSSRLAALNLDTHAITVFDQQGFTPQWVAAGFVTLTSSDGSMIAVPFDAKRGRPTGAPVTIARDMSQPDAFVSRAAVSASGAILYPQAGAIGPRRLALVDRSGSVSLLPGEGRVYTSPRFSPDGRRLALGITDQAGATDVWVLDIAQRTWSRITTSGITKRPAWTPDGRRLVYSSNDDLWWITADGSGRPESLLVANGNRFAGSVTPDGRGLVFQEQASARNGIRSMIFDSAPASRLLIPGNFGESAPALSPDGRWLAYQSDETGQMEVYVRPYPGPGGQVLVSLHGGTEPVWAHGGRELYFREGDSLMAATVTLSPAFEVTGRRPLFSGAYASGDSYREYDVAPDDRHFVMLSGGAARSVLIGLQHAFDRLGSVR